MGVVSGLVVAEWGAGEELAEEFEFLLADWLLCSESAMMAILAMLTANQRLSSVGDN